MCPNLRAHIVAQIANSVPFFGFIVRPHGMYYIISPFVRIDH